MTEIVEEAATEAAEQATQRTADTSVVSTAGGCGAGVFGVAAPLDWSRGGVSVVLRRRRVGVVIHGSTEVV